MMGALLITVQLHDARYHGTDDWPPSPARLFQALVAGAARGATLPPAAAEVLSWLETLPPPRICAPHARRGRQLRIYVPNNDIDALGGDVGKVAEIRVAKATRPWFLDRSAQFLYVWSFDPPAAGGPPVSELRAVANQLYQFGRGVDMAWARAEMVETEELARRLHSHEGVLYRPIPGDGGLLLDVPTSGSLESLILEYRENRRRFARLELGRNTQVIFRRPPKPQFRPVKYNAPPEYRLFELRSDANDAPFARIPLHDAALLAAQLRDGAIERLTSALPKERAIDVERTLRNRDAPMPHTPRTRVIPLPSIGHEQVDRAIRRVLVEVPGDSPIRSDDVAWAFSGMLVRDRVDVETGEVLQEIRLVHTTDERMLHHYGIGDDGRGHRRWRTVTPAALPLEAARRRTEPMRRHEEAKGGPEFAREHAAACRAVLQAVRHAQVCAKVERLEVRRQPFEVRGDTAEAFAPGTRFDKARLWHIEIEFDRPLHGPIVIGDGRFAGLGLMAPAPIELQHSTAYAFEVIDGLRQHADPAALARDLRRAVLARVQSTLGLERQLASWFTGHESDGSPSRGEHAHLFFHPDLPRKRLVVFTPGLFRRDQRPLGEQRHLEILGAALQGFDTLTAGITGCLALQRVALDVDQDLLLAPTRVWESVTWYVPARYPKGTSARDGLIADISTELDRRALPRARIEVLDIHEGRRGAISGKLRLHFRGAVRGPIALGRACHLGGGLFAGTPA